MFIFYFLIDFKDMQNTFALLGYHYFAYRYTVYHKTRSFSMLFYKNSLANLVFLYFIVYNFLRYSKRSL